MPLGGALTAILSAAGPILGGILNGGAQSNQNDAMNKLIGQYMQQYGLGYNTLFGNGAASLYPQLQDLMRSNLNNTNQGIYGNSEGQGGALQQYQNQNASTFDPQGLLNTIMGGSFDPYGQQIPGVQNALGTMGGLPSDLQTQADLARAIFQGQGSTPESRQSFGVLSPLMEGQGAQQQALTGMANNIFGSNGQSQNPLSASFMNAAAQGITGSNPMLNFANQGAQGIFNAQGQTGPTNQGIDAASGMYANGGMTPALNQLQNTGFNVLGGNGLTPTGQQGEQAALQTINSQGQTPTTQGLQGLGLGLASRPSLLPMDQVASMASNQAATDYANNAQAAERQALARGGGPGATVANGLQNSGMADYADKGSQAEAQARQQALVQQQALQLQQAGMGANMAEQGGTLQNNRFGTASNTLTGLEQVAANRFGLGGNFIQGATQQGTNRASTGLNALDALAGLQSGRQMGALGQIPGIAQTGINQANVYGNLGLGSNAQNLQALGMGTGMYGDVMSNMLGNNNSFNNLAGMQNQYGLGAGQLGNQGTNDIGSILNEIIGGNMGASQQGLTRTQDFLNQNQQGLSNQMNSLNFMGNQQSSNQNYGNALLANMLSMMNQGITGASGFYTPFPQQAQNPWAGILSSVLQGAGKLPGMGGGIQNPGIGPAVDNMPSLYP